MRGSHTLRFAFEVGEMWNSYWKTVGTKLGAGHLYLSHNEALRPISHCRSRLQGTALDSADLPNMPAQPAVPQRPWPRALGRPAGGPARGPGR